MGWASEAFHNDIMRAASKSGMFLSGGLSVVQGSDTYRERKTTVEKKKEVKKQEENFCIPRSNFNVKATKVFDGKSNNHLGLFNVDIEGFMTINGINLWINLETGEYSCSMPVKKSTKGTYFPIIKLDNKDLNFDILHACIKANSKEDK